MVEIGIIGFGLMGRTHLGGYQADARCRVRAVADNRPETVHTQIEGGNIDAQDPGMLCPADAVVYTSAEELLEDESIDAVSICLPTPLHVDIALAAVKAGKNVLIEKPLALNAADAGRVVAAAEAQAELVIMPAMCMRFWPGWRWLREQVTAGSWGKVRHATFQRFGERPGWGGDFYNDAASCGGAILDLHIHDVDFIRACFGDPAAVSATGMTGPSGGIDHISARFSFPDGPEWVVAEGGWLECQDFPFVMRYLVQFEEATACFDLGRDPVLEVHHRGGASETVERPGLGSVTGYEREIGHFLDCIIEGQPSTEISIADGAAAIRLVESERESIQSGMPASPTIG